MLYKVYVYIYICFFFFVFFFFSYVLNIFLGCEGKREEKKKMHVLIYFIDLFLFYVLYNHLFLIHVMDNFWQQYCASHANKAHLNLN